jgi:hypothetical protein
MAMNKTRYGRKAVLDHFCGRVEHVFSTGIWMALFSADPTETGTQTSEITQGGYARVNISAKLGDADLTSGVISNAAVITFGPATADWDEVTHMGLCTSSTIGGGNMIYFGPATVSRVIANTDDFNVQIGQLTIQER